MRNSRRVVFLRWARTERHRGVPTEMISEGRRQWWLITYSLVASDFMVVCNVANHVLAPYERMVIVGFESFGNKLCPIIERLQSFLTKYIR